MIKKTDIIISGGGLSGLIATVAFGSSGYNVLCVEPNTSFEEINSKEKDIRTTAYLQPSQAFLQKIGIWPLVAHTSTPLDVMRIADAAGDNLTIRDFNSSDISNTPFGWNVGNWDMRIALLDQIGKLPNVDFRSGVFVKKIFTRSTCATVTLSDELSIDAKLVVAADGRNSSIRSEAGIEVKQVDFEQSALSFSVTHALPHRNISTEVHKAGGPFTLVPLPDYKGQPSSAVVWMDSTENINKINTMPIAAFNTAITERSAEVLGKLNSVTNRTIWPIISQLAQRFYAERIAFIAEAAHVLPPIGAQGLNLTIGDIKTLLELVNSSSHDVGSLNVLKKYNRIRQPVAQAKVIGIGWLNRASKAEGPVGSSARKMGLNLIYNIKPLRQALMQIGTGLH